MGRFVGFILAIGTIAIGIATGNPAIIAAGASQLVAATVNLIFGPKAPPTPVSEQQVRDPKSPRAYGYGTRRVFGSLAFWDNKSDGGTVDVVAFVDGRANAIRRVYLNDEQVSVSNGGTVSAIEKKYQGGRVRVGWNLGQTPAPVHSPVVSALPGIWTNNHRGDGVVSGYIIKSPEREEKFLETYPQGDNVTLSLVIDMQLCFDPRTGQTVWTENPVLHLLHYFIVRRGYDYNTKILPQIDKWIAAANVCDEIVSGEPRYRGCVLYDSRAKPAEVIGSILETFDGYYAENERGEVIVYAGEYYTPTVTIGPEHIIEYEHQSFIEDENIINELSVTYVSSQHDYNQVEAQPWRDETDISARGFVNSTSFNPQTPSFKQNRRLAKISMARNNTPDRGVVVTNYGGRIAEGHRFINLNIVEAGTTIYSGPAEITKITRNLETHGLTIEWTRAEPNAWSWNPATEDGYGAPTGSASIVSQPSPPSIDAAVFAFDNAAQTASLEITGTGPNRDDLTWFARIREQGASAWEEKRYNDAAPGATVVLSVAVIPTDTPIEVQIAFSTGGRRFSGWSGSTIVTADTSAEPPGAASVPTLVSWNGVITMNTDPIARASSYIWRIYQSDGTTLVSTRSTFEPRLVYTASQAASDGVQRSYIITVAGVNGAGEGALATSALISNPAPETVTNVAATGGDFIATITFDASTATDLTGYIIFYSKTASFDPMTTGFAEIRGTSNSQQLFSLGAGTYYAKVAALDGWSINPSYLNISTEVSFTITSGSSGGIGGTGSGGGTGGPSGGGIYEEIQ